MTRWTIEKLGARKWAVLFVDYNGLPSSTHHTSEKLAREWAERELGEEVA